MLLQAEKPIVVWGKGLPGKTVTARISNDQSRTLVAADSTWELSLPKQKASGHPNRLIVAMEGETVTLDDILVGDLWLCIGQSNMEWPMSREKHWDMEKADADQPMIRFTNPPPAGRYVYGVPYGDSLKDRLTPARFYDWDGWRVCDSQTVASMSAVAYHFAKRLRQDVDRPIGLINLSIGGAPLESFIGLDVLERHSRFQGKVKGDWLHNDSLPVWVRERGRQNVGGGNARYLDATGPNHAFKPGFAYASGIAPLSRMPVKGFLVYQGESNAEEEARVREYGELFRSMVDAYRKAWKDDRLPFYWVQLSSIERPFWPKFRDGQRRLLDELDHVGMAVTSDVGMRNDVHPRDKRTVGERLARWALADTYRRPIVASGPLPASARHRKGRVVLSFRFSRGGLRTSDGLAPREFSFDGVSDAEARIRGRKVIVPTVSKPESIYHGWKPYTLSNLVNAVGLPASTFKIAVR